MEDNQEEEKIEQPSDNESGDDFKHEINPGFVEASDKEFEKLAKEELQQHNESNEQDLSVTQMAKATVRFILKAIACCIVIFIVYMLVFYRPPKSQPVSHRVSACFANSRVILGAIEMNNLDNTEMIHVLTEESMKQLVNGKYLKSVPTPPTPECKYKSYEENDNIVVYCDFHGEPGTNMIKDQPSPYLAAKNAENKKGTIIAFAIPILLIIAAIWAFR